MRSSKQDEDDAEVHPRSSKRTWPSQEQDEEDEDEAEVYPTLHITPSVHTLTLYLVVFLTFRMVLGAI